MINRGDPTWFDPQSKLSGPGFHIARLFGVAAASGSLRDWDEAEPVLRELWAELGDDLDWPHARQAMYMIRKRAKH